MNRKEFLRRAANSAAAYTVVGNRTLLIAAPIGAGNNNPAAGDIPPLPPRSRSSPEPATTITLSVDMARQIGTSRFETGITHTQHGLDVVGDPASVERAKRLLAAATRYHNVHLMGWGTMNPNPAPGVYDWESLDRRLDMVRSIPGAVPVLTLCAAPDWMKGGESGKTDWSRIEVAPRPEHYQDFADLAATVARRYPHVRHFQVWNEMKGLWKPSTNNWDYENYTRLYNRCYDALKKVNPQIQVGGLYLVIEGTGSGKDATWATEAPIRARQWDVIN